MSFPPHGPPYYGPLGWKPPNPSHQKPNQPYPSQPDFGRLSVHGPPMSYPYYVPGAVMVPMPMPMPKRHATDLNKPTYKRNIIHQSESSNQYKPSKFQISESEGDYNWVPSSVTAASSLSEKAVIGGREGWDGSPLWVIRAWHCGELMLGKLSVRHNSASITYNGKEIPLQNIEVLCAKPESLRWVPSSNGSVPPAAIPGGKTARGEKLYVGRARHQLSITPGKVQTSHKVCYIGFGGAEVSNSMYDVLCRII